jgi:hypothetical protein
MDIVGPSLAFQDHADRLEAEEPVHHLLGELLAGHAQIDLGRAFRRHDVDARAALDQPDIAGDAARISGLGLDSHDLLRHLVDGAAPVLVAHAGMSRQPLHRQREVADAAVDAGNHLLTRFQRSASLNQQTVPAFVMALL